MTEIVEAQDINEQVKVPEEILKKIKNAWVAGLISIGVTVAFTMISMTGADILGLDAWAFADVILMFIFVFGIYKKSRTCAILLLLLFIANKALMWLEMGVANGLPLALIFLWFYTQGVIGTFQYHAYLKNNS